MQIGGKSLHHLSHEHHPSSAFSVIDMSAPDSSVSAQTPTKLGAVENVGAPASSAPAGNPAQSHQFLGARISITTVSNMRYEGTLYSVDTAKSTVALSDGT
jgi:hypothetical protein